ncbi:MAG: hypothetical protein IPG50_07275 [Myxococcales bacterium]|nr:hypothetical protein [Myxococcales bacterium]
MTKARRRASRTHPFRRTAVVWRRGETGGNFGLAARLGRQRVLFRRGARDACV